MNMKHSINKIFLFFLLVFTFCGAMFSSTHAQVSTSSVPGEISSGTEGKFSRGKVMTIVRTGNDEVGDRFQDVRILFLSGALEGTEREIHVVNTVSQESQILKVGDKVILLQTASPDGSTQFSVIDLYRLPKIIFFVLIFFAIILWVVGVKRGLFSLVGLCWSIVVLMFFIVPKIASGSSPLLISTLGAFAIVVFSIILAHGLHRRTIVASIGTFVTLIFSVLLAVMSTKFTRLFGMGSEDAQFLLSSPLGAIDLSGLLMAGIIIGTLGVLDDVTTSQAAAVEEIHQANKTLSVRELYKRGMTVGKEHIIALVNTLVLAYAGAALPILLLLSIYSQPIWVTLSSEMIGEEIVRTLSGSISLILAVPITTGLAAFFAGVKENK